MTLATLELERLSKRYRGGVDALVDLSLTVGDGELVALVGPSGCGKSTALSLIAGLDEPTGGSIRIEGRDVTGLSPGARDVAMVFQSYALYPHLDVRSNLSFPLEVAGIPRAEIASRVRDTAELLGLTELLERRPRELSGGQRQRVALGRALVRRPKVFLFDEPLSNLDAALRGQMRAELKKLHERLAATFVYVTHDQAEAMTLCSRLVVMREGRVQQVAPPREVYDRPANAFVARFFGTPRINLVPPAILGLSPPSASAAQAGVRPEHLELGLGEPPAGAVRGRVFLVEPAGSEAWVSVELGGEQVVVRTPPDVDAPAGAAAWVRPREGRVLWFDASGARLDAS